MEKPRTRVPISLPIATVVLLALGLIANPLVQAWATPQQLAENVLLSAIPFILVFVAIVLGYVILIWFAASRLNHNVPRRIYRPIEIALIAGIALGAFGMFQPWVFGLYKIGFFLLLVATLAFILWSHVTPASDHYQEEEMGTLGIGDLDSTTN